MTEIKKTYNNPPSGLIKAVLKNSSSEIWETAKEEWKFYKYFYNTTQKPVFCPCSAREINHIVVIKNIITGNLLEIDICCAETYFRINKVRKIKESIHRLCKNIDWGMYQEALDYLYDKRCINDNEYMDYEIARQRRESKHPHSNLIRNVRHEINRMFINYTKYENKEYFNTIDYLIGISENYPKLDVSKLVNMRKSAIKKGKMFFHKLIDIMDYYDIYVDVDKIRNYSEDKMVEILDKYTQHNMLESLRHYVDEKEYYYKITKYNNNYESKEDFIKRVESKIRRRKNKGNKVKDNINLTLGLEDEIIDLDSPDIIDYDNDSEWDEEKFESDTFCMQASDNMIKEFTGLLCDWTVNEMRRNGIISKKGKNTIYTLEDIVSFIDITTITKHFEIYKITSFYELFTENISIKYSYQHLDKLIRKGHSDIMKTQLEKLKKILRKENFKLIHNDKVTYIKSSRKNKHEVIYYQDTTQRDGKIDLSLGLEDS